MALKRQPRPASIEFASEPAAENTIFEVVWCGNYDWKQQILKTAAIKKWRSYHHFDPEKTAGKCECQPGSQKLAIHNTARELANVGGRGGMKTETGLVIALRAGDGGPGHVPYINFPNYQCLILRKNTKDLDDWANRGKRLYCPMGAEFTSSPSPRFRWPSGAMFYLDHVQDKDAYQKYQGQEFQTIIWEEVTHCPDLETYKNIERSARSKDPRMKEKLYLTANPEGPGLSWLRERFWKLKDREGNPIRRGQIWRDPKFPLLTRSVIHSTIYDNPFLQRYNPSYVQSLESLEGIARKKWLDGDFDVFEGSAFSLFRPDGPLDKSEPENARHVIEVKSAPMQPWWPRVVGFDIGYRHSAACVKGCITPDRQLIVYGEKAEAGVLAIEWGAKLAHWLVQELRDAPESVIEVFMSHDAFSHLGYEKTRAAMVHEGIEQILPVGSAFTIRQEEGEKMGDFFERYRNSAKQARIVLRKLPRGTRVDGWEYLRELMRWRPLGGAAPQEAFDQEHVEDLIRNADDGGYRAYMKMFEAVHESEKLPKMLWTTECEKTIEALRTAQFAEGKSDSASEDLARPSFDVFKTKHESDDILDACRHLVLGFRFKVEHEPREFLVNQRLELALQARPSLAGAQLWKVKARINDDLDRERAGRMDTGFSIRFGSPDNRGVRIQS